MSRRVRPDPREIGAAFGTRLREVRVMRGLSQEQVAHAAGMSRNHIQNLENNRNNARDASGERDPGPANPALQTIWALAAALDVGPERLVRDRAVDHG